MHVRPNENLRYVFGILQPNWDKSLWLYPGIKRGRGGGVSPFRPGLPWINIDSLSTTLWVRRCCRVCITDTEPKECKGVFKETNGCCSCRLFGPGKTPTGSLCDEGNWRGCERIPLIVTARYSFKKNAILFTGFVV